MPKYVARFFVEGELTIESEHSNWATAVDRFTEMVGPFGEGLFDCVPNTNFQGDVRLDCVDVRESGGSS